MNDNAVNYGVDWTNVNLTDSCQRDQPILDAYTFDTLLLEISCNLPEISKETVTAEFEKQLQSKIRSARKVFVNNVDNIVNQAKAEQ